MRTLLITTIFILFTSSLISQDYSPLRGKEEFIAMGDKKYNREHYPSAILYYERAFKLDAADTEVLLKLAHSYQELGDIEGASQYYELAERTGQPLPEEFYLNFAETLLQAGDRDRSAQYLEKYASISSSKQHAWKRLQGLQVYHEFYLDTLSYSVSELEMNTPKSDLSPMFYQDDIIYLSSRPIKKGILQKKDHRTGQGFYKAYSLNSPDGTAISGLQNSVEAYHQGPMVFFNGYSEAYSTENVPSDEDHIVRLKLFHLKWDSASLTVLPHKTKLPFNQDGFSTGHPATNSDGSLIIFVSDMPFGYGGTDLYLSQRVNGEWTKPENLGETINTPGNEMFPFLSSEGQLYFASNGHPGLGGLDILRVNLEKRAPVINPGAPLNSRYNDFGLIIDEETDKGYFSSNRREGKGAEDLYHFNVYRVDVTARMVNQETNDIIEGDFAVTSLRNGEEIAYERDKGNILFKGLLDHEYVIKGKPDLKSEVTKQVKPRELADSGKPVDLLVDPADLVRPVRVIVKLVRYNDEPFDGEVFVTELGGRGDLMVNKDDQGLSFSGLTKTDYALVAYREEATPFMATFHTRNVRPEEELVVYEFPIDQEQGGGPLLSSGSPSTPSPPPGQTVLLTFNSGGPEENWLRSDSTWIPYKPEEMTIPPGNRVRIGPFYFDTDRSDLREEAKRELTQLYHILSTREMPELLITGYADVRGSKTYNTALSWQRARAVKSYIVSLGYDEDSISTIGLGESNLAGNCEKCDKEQYQVDRRVTLAFQ